MKEKGDFDFDYGSTGRYKLESQPRSQGLDPREEVAWKSALKFKMADTSV